MNEVLAHTVLSLWPTQPVYGRLYYDCEKRPLSVQCYNIVFLVADTLSVNSYGMPQSGSTVSQRESSSFLPVTQPASAPASPVGSPVSQLLSDLSNITLDPNWQAIKSTVRERNAAMFNNDLMADIYFVVGNPGLCLIDNIHSHNTVIRLLLLLFQDTPNVYHHTSTF